MDKKGLKFNTKTIHGGQALEKAYGAVMPPIYQTSTFAQTAPGEHLGYGYARGANPTRTALENSLASLENGTHGFAFGSGMAAIDAVLKLLRPKDEVLCTNDIYGGSYRIFKGIFEHYGITFKFVDLSNPTYIKQHLSTRTKMVWLESPTNPMMQLVDIAGIANAIADKDILLVVDNTFATPYLQRPLDLGADIVMHSATKYLGGHSDVVVGGLIVKETALAERIKFIQNSSGAICGPMDSFLTLRGIKTLHVRMQRHCENAERIAYFLKEHPKVAKVYWPGFAEHPNHHIAKKQMSHFGAMLSFTLQTEAMEHTKKFISRLKLFTLAESLGGVESLVGHPATMSHGSMPEEERLKNGITDNLIRLSVGIEAVEDLLNDLSYALDEND
ncbi:trans-sulfuration enzyme family protein [Croceivirga sp. JEA036]|uniref:trans-sulfuration enzyme family protein n=1 Tax=Croceivirga sp. JEA036 TaxID=2721162 RepID=UPI00143AA031|nr:PLP-dependent aspartate aminotransferase family protein [Croceivirga sp. JEA036]NJB36889.1 PLP-dependent transferase [Croceivirga sp. JEA036]